MCCAYWRTISRWPMSWLGALYCAPLTVKMAYLLTRAGSSSYSAVRRAGSDLSNGRSTARRLVARALRRCTIVSTNAS